MATPTIESQPATTGEPRETPPRKAIEEQEFHLLIEELRDENSRYRMREAVWISIILHVIALFAIKEVPKYLPQRSVTLVQPAELLKDKELTYVEQPPDQQVVKEKPQTDKISDKDRIASSRNPQLQKMLEELNNARRQGPTGPPIPQQQPTPPPLPQQTPQQGAQQQAQSSVGPTPPQQRSQQQPKLEQPMTAKQNPFGGFATGSAGSSIEQAARASSQTRGGGGAGGEYGTGPGRAAANMRSNYEFLSDTMGVDFGPYMERVLHTIRTNWYPVIPEIAQPPLSKQGNVVIEFVIMPDGSVQGIRLAGPSGVVALDRAAWTGIRLSSPFQHLPSDFKGPYLALRIKFMYNPDAKDLR